MRGLTNAHSAATDKSISAGLARTGAPAVRLIRLGAPAALR